MWRNQNLITAVRSVVPLSNFPCNLSRNLVALLRQKLHGSLPSVTYMNMSRNAFVAMTVTRSRIDLYVSQRLQEQKICDIFISGHITLGNHSCNLCYNKIARQVEILPSVTAP